MSRSAAMRVVIALALAAGACEPLSVAIPNGGRTWELLSLEPATPDVAVALTFAFRLPTLSLTPDAIDPTYGTLLGFAGCNHFEGRYRAMPGGAFDVKSLISTYVGCPVGIAGLEGAFLDGLGQATQWRMDGEQLVLTTRESVHLRFGTPARLFALQSVNNAQLPFVLTATATDTTQLVSDSILLRSNGVAAVKWRLRVRSSDGVTVEDHVLPMPFSVQGDSIHFASIVTCVVGPCPWNAQFAGTWSDIDLVLSRFPDFGPASYHYASAWVPQP